MKIGLVLGAGGIQGGAWLTGGLDALAEETGWDPAAADYVIGTSAGAMIGALCASGVPPWFMVAHSRGETFEGVRDAQGGPAATADRAAGARFELERTWPPVGPGSWPLGLRTLVNPRRYPPATVFSGWVWRGVFSTKPLEETIRRVVPTGWGPRPNLWIAACDYETGLRTPFGRVGAPPADLADAVAASCAIPGIYHPVTIGNRRFVDGASIRSRISTCCATKAWTLSSASTRPLRCTRSARSTPATPSPSSSVGPPVAAWAARRKSSAPT